MFIALSDMVCPTFEGVCCDDYTCILYAHTSFQVDRGVHTIIRFIFVVRIFFVRRMRKMYKNYLHEYTCSIDTVNILTVSVRLTPGALSDPVLVDTVTQHWLWAIGCDCIAVGLLFQSPSMHAS